MMKFQNHTLASTRNGTPTDLMLKVALCSKIDQYWQERLEQALGPVETMRYKDMVAEIERTL